MIPTISGGFTLDSTKGIPTPELLANAVGFVTTLENQGYKEQTHDKHELSLQFVKNGIYITFNIGRNGANLWCSEE